MKLKKIRLNGTDNNKNISVKKHYLVAQDIQGKVYYSAGQFDENFGRLEFDLGSHSTILSSFKSVWEILGPHPKFKKPKPKKKIPESKCTCRPAPDDVNSLFWQQDEEIHCPYHNQ